MCQWKSVLRRVYCTAGISVNFANGNVTLLSSVPIFTLAFSFYYRRICYYIRCKIDYRIISIIENVSRIYR